MDKTKTATATQSLCGICNQVFSRGHACLPVDPVINPAECNDNKEKIAEYVRIPGYRRGGM